MSEPVRNVHAFCRRLLERGDLATKLAPPPADLADLPTGPALEIDRPARERRISLSSGAERLPRPGALGDPDARARCLARFAHHELMAAELFAWALIRWPELPSGLRAALLEILADEQRHCRMYLDRLDAHGGSLADFPRSDYFWRHAKTIADSPHGPRAFLCAMGLTLEQANLDFSALYREGFRSAGDAASAEVCHAVHEDEIRHVRVAATWLQRLSAPGMSDLDAYLEAVPFPFAPARAKGRAFDAASRRRAGLSDAFIETVRGARGRTLPADVKGPARLFGNVGSEQAPGGTSHPAARAVARLWRLLFAAGVPDATEDDPATGWPTDLGPPPDGPVFPWLEETGLAAWHNTDAAQAQARASSLALIGAEPDAVHRVHDKAFAHRICEREGLIPAALRDCIAVLSPADLGDADAALATLQARVDAWPAWMGARFALKPRHGGSGRGRVGGEGRIDTDAVRGALPRLARCGGALLEPWLERGRDLSVQLHVSLDGTLTLVSTLEQIVSASGVWRGHAGEIDYRGRVVSGTDEDDALLEAAMVVARAAHGEGFHGPCGVDAFTFATPDGEQLRACVELNARFTTGTVTAGLLRRARPAIAEALGLTSGTRRPFRFALDAQWTDAPGRWRAAFDVGGGLQPMLALGVDAGALAELDSAR